MSAHMVSTTHIDALLTAGLRLSRPTDRIRWFWPPIDAESDRGNWTSADEQRQARERRQELTEQTAGRVGAVLLAENARSLDHRYDAEEIEEPHLFTALPGRPDSVLVLNAIDYYEYQSSEHSGWETSEARAFCQALRARAIRALPGYDDAPWGIDDPHVFVHSAHRAT